MTWLKKIGVKAWMESRDYVVFGFNVSDLAQGFLDAFSFVIVVLALGYQLGLPVSLEMFWVAVKYLVSGYVAIRIAEFSGKLIDEVRGLE